MLAVLSDYLLQLFHKSVMVDIPFALCLEAVGRSAPQDIFCIKVFENACKDMRNSLMTSNTNKSFGMVVQATTCLRLTLGVV